MSVGVLSRLPLLVVRRLRWRLGRWSRESDRRYHEHLYRGQQYDPFVPDYPGYVTIRRFADHAETLLPDKGTVLDVGCGPGEITCELARRHPALAFLGVDHSAAAIERARENADRLSLANVRFHAGAAEDLPAGDRYALVTLFDAFHHLEDPGQFMVWLRAHTSRCVLIEPAGTVTGRWARGIDIDWLLADLANVRDRLEAACGDPPPSSAPAGTAATSAGTGLRRGEGAVERRYALADFERFFDGWSLRVTGTVAGIDAYPPGAYARSALRPVVGETAYALVRAVDTLLVERERDGAAKHWVVAATSESGLLAPRMPRTTVPSDEAGPLPPVSSAYDVRYLAYDGPATMRAGSTVRATIEIVNDGWDEWTSGAVAPVHVSYHWLGADGTMQAQDGVRSPLPRSVASGERCRVLMTVTAPSTPGDYVLAVDLVREGVAWFSDAGVPWHTSRVQVR